MQKYPIFVMAGRDKERREIMQKLDPEKKYSVKAQLPFLNRRVIDFVLDALLEAKNVGQVYIVGQDEESLPCNQPVEYIDVATDSTIFEKFQAILNHLNTKNIYPEKFIFCTSDTPAIKSESIEKFVSEVEKNNHCNLIISVVPIQLEIDEYGPEHNRVVGKFTDAEVFPGEMYAISREILEGGENEVKEFASRRKKRTFWATAIYVLKKVILKPRIWGKVIKLIFGKASIGDAKIIFEKAFNIQGEVVIMDDLGFGFDLDLPEDYHKLEEYVKKTKAEYIKKE